MSRAPGPRGFYELRKRRKACSFRLVVDNSVGRLDWSATGISGALTKSAVLGCALGCGLGCGAAGSSGSTAGTLGRSTWWSPRVVSPRPSAVGAASMAGRSANLTGGVAAATSANASAASANSASTEARRSTTVVAGGRTLGPFTLGATIPSASSCAIASARSSSYRPSASAVGDGELIARWLIASAPVQAVAEASPVQQAGSGGVGAVAGTTARHHAVAAGAALPQGRFASCTARYCSRRVDGARARLKLIVQCAAWGGHV